VKATSAISEMLEWFKQVGGKLEPFGAECLLTHIVPLYHRQRGGKLHGVTVQDMGEPYGNGIVATRKLEKKVKIEGNANATPFPSGRKGDSFSLLNLGCITSFPFDLGQLRILQRSHSLRAPLLSGYHPFYPQIPDHQSIINFGSIIRSREGNFPKGFRPRGGGNMLFRMRCTLCAYSFFSLVS